MSIKYFLIEFIADKKVVTQKDSARIQLVSKNIQLGSARYRKPTSSAWLGKIQLGSARLGSPISSSNPSLVNTGYSSMKC